MPDNDKKEIRPFVKPGQELGYVAPLKKSDNWPPKRRDPKQDDRKRTQTPYLVVPVGSGDIGVRPLPSNQALYNSNIEIVDSGGHVVTMPVPGTTYTLRCRAINLGAAGAYGGMAQFYVGRATDFDAKATVPRSTMPIFALTGFIAMPGATVTITCPKPWRPANAAEAASCIVVAVYDAFVDPVIQPFNAITDRHIGRHDPIPDFSGTWTGLEVRNESLVSPVLKPPLSPVILAHADVPTLVLPHLLPTNVTATPPNILKEISLPDSLVDLTPIPHTVPGQPLPPGGYLFKIVITQSGLTVNASIYAQVGGQLPAQPQNVGTGTISGNQVQIATTDFLNNGATPFTSNLYVLSLSNPATLHFTHHRHFLMPGDTRPDMDFHGDLTRS